MVFSLLNFKQNFVQVDSRRHTSICDVSDREHTKQNRSLNLARGIEHSYRIGRSLDASTFPSVDARCMRMARVSETADRRVCEFVPSMYKRSSRRTEFLRSISLLLQFANGKKKSFRSSPPTHFPTISDPILYSLLKITASRNTTTNH